MHLLAFAGTYLLVRGRLPTRRMYLKRPPLSIVVALVAVYLSIEAFSMFVGLFYNTSFDTYLGPISWRAACRSFWRSCSII